MMLRIPGVLPAPALQKVLEILRAAEWIDGRATAGHQSQWVKSNQQLPEDGPAARAAGDIVLAHLERSPRFISAVLPQRVFPPLFNQYAAGMSFGSHIDNAIRGLANSAERVRTDVSATLFLSDPDSYDGGELIVEDTYGRHSAKLPAGDLVIYPASSLHHVTAVTRGVRLASFFWIQSLIRDVGQRSLLFDLDMAIVDLHKGGVDNPALLSLTGVYHNLVRRWAEP